MQNIGLYTHFLHETSLVHHVLSNHCLNGLRCKDVTNDETIGKNTLSNNCYVLKLQCYASIVQDPKCNEDITDICNIGPTVKRDSKERHWQSWFASVDKWAHELMGNVTGGHIVLVGSAPHSVYVRIGMHLRHLFVVKIVPRGCDASYRIETNELSKFLKVSIPFETMQYEVKCGVAVLFITLTESHHISSTDISTIEDEVKEPVSLVVTGRYPRPKEATRTTLTPQNFVDICSCVLSWVDEAIKIANRQSNITGLCFATSAPTALAFVAGIRLNRQVLGKRIFLLDRIHEGYEAVWSSE